MEAPVLCGVNLGGWFVLERLTTPSLFEGVVGNDETSVIKQLGIAGKQLIKKHHENYITEADFKWLHQKGINAIRLPVPHWAFGDISPYVGCIEKVDWVFEMAKKYKLQVLLDLHTASGSQNGQDHSGVEGSTKWHKDPANISSTLAILERFAGRYRNYPNLWGIELLNEPDIKIPIQILQNFYNQAYSKLRQLSSNVMIVMHDSFRPEQWGTFFSDHDFDNAILDMHLYQVFGGDDKKADIHRHLKKALGRRELLEDIQANLPAIVGEWSLGLPPRAFRGLDDWESDKARQAFGRAQINTYQKSLGWFYWTYKTEDDGGWNFRNCVERGWLPPSFHEPVTIETVV